MEPNEPRPRLDHFLVSAELGVSRSRLKRLIDSGHVTVDNKVATASSKLSDGQLVVVSIPEPTSATAEPEDIPLDVAYEDEDLIVVNKPAGMVVHPAPGHPSGTLVNALVHHCGDLSGIGGELRPGIVHRIDKDTSGLLVATKNDATHTKMAELFAAHDIERAYLAVVAPPPTNVSGTFSTLFGRHPNARKKFSSRVKRGKRAVTHYKRLRVFRELAALVECRLETGRTHQIRVHFADAGSPLLADPLYARKRHGVLGELAAKLGRQALHAAVLGFVHPRTGATLRFEAKLPADMAALIDALE